jgi:TRAP-type C4-dicarboxylate transport system permease small subunit
MKHVARRILGNFEEDAAAVLMAAILAVLGLQVFTRYVLGNPLSWTEEVARHLFIWMVFFGASAAIRDGTHVSIDLLVSRLPKGLHAVVTAVNRMWSLPTATLEIPIGLVYVVLPISAVLMMIRTVVRLRVDLRGGQVVRTVTID